MSASSWSTVRSCPRHTKRPRDLYRRYAKTTTFRLLAGDVAGQTPFCLDIAIKDRAPLNAMVESVTRIGALEVSRGRAPFPMRLPRGLGRGLRARRGVKEKHEHHANKMN